MKPFSYDPIPVVRYGNGGNLYQGFGKSRLTFQQGKPYISNNAGTFLPEVNIVEDKMLPEDPRNTSGFAESNGTYYLNGVPTGEAPLEKDALTGLVESLPAVIASGGLGLGKDLAVNAYKNAIQQGFSAGIGNSGSMIGSGLKSAGYFLTPSTWTTAAGFGATVGGLADATMISDMAYHGGKNLFTVQNWKPGGRYNNNDLLGLKNVENLALDAMSLVPAVQVGRYMIGNAPLLRYRTRMPSMSTSISGGSKPYYYDEANKVWNTKLLQDDVSKGKQAAVDYLGSDFRRSVDARNERLAKIKGYGDIGHVDDRMQNLSVPFEKVMYSTDPNAGFYAEIARDRFDPRYDWLTLNLTHPVEDPVYHELLHRADIGASYTNRNSMATQQRINREAFQYDLLKKVVKPKTSSEYANMSNGDKMMYDYITGNNVSGMVDSQDQLELPANMLELGKVLGIKPGQPYPGKDKVIEILDMAEKSSKVTDEKKHMLKFLDKNNTKYIWRALNGGLFGLAPFVIDRENEKQD